MESILLASLECRDECILSVAGIIVLLVLVSTTNSNIRLLLFC